MSLHAPKNPGRCLLVAALAVALTAASTAAGRVAAAEIPGTDPTIAPRLVEVALGAMPLETFLEAGLDVVEVRGPSRVRILEWPKDAATLARLGLATTLIDADPGATAAARARAELAARPAPEGRRVMSATGADGVYRIQVLPPFGSGSMGGYWTLAEVKMKLDELVANDAQDLIAAKLDTLGTTHQGRPIWGLRIAKGVVGPDTRPVVFYNAITHAREPEGMQALFYFVDDLLGKYGTDPTATYLLENRVIYIVPVVNPDGYMRNQTTNPGGGGFWRKNLRDNDASGTVTSGDGVDINRNYGFQWGLNSSGSSGSPGSDTYRGPSAFSEPETQAQRNIVVSLQPRTGLSFHTYGDLLLHPWGYTTGAPPDSNVFYEWEDDMSLGSGYTTGQGIRVLYAVNGEFNDWTYGDVALKPRAYTWTPEIGGPNDGFWPAPSRIVPLAQENLRHAYYVASIAGPYVRVERSSVLNGPLTAASSHWVAVRARNKGVNGNAGPGLIGTLSSLSAGASVVSGPVAYPTLAPLTSADADNNGMFLVAVDDTVTAGRLLRLRMDFSAPDGFFSRDTVELVCGVPTVLATENASGTLAAWTVVGGWGIVSNDPVHPSRYVADSPSGTYTDSDTTNMLTRTGTLNLSSGVHAYAFYDARWQFESDFDCGVLEASLNGTTWIPVLATGSSLGRSGGVQPVGKPVYDGARYLWREERADLSPFSGPAGSAVRLRFRVRSDAGSVLDGLNFDSLRVMVYDPAQQPSPVAVGDGELPALLTLAPPAPNPVRGAALFSFSLPSSGDVRLELFDLMGRHVRTLAAAMLPAGRYVRSWDRRDESGRPIPAGVYLARLSGAAGAVSRRFVVLNFSAAALDAVGPSAPHLVEAALRLHAQLEFRHLHGGRIEGADQGVRWNIRVWRFWRSYFPALSRRERHFFLQGQGYWALANWALFDLTHEPRFRQRAWEATEVIDHTQRLTGAWIYPLRERRRLVATVEGDFAAVAMLEAYRRGLGDHMLEAAKRWHDYVELSIGYQDHPGGIAINYFDRPRGLVPNNTAEWIWVLGRFATVTGDDRFLGRVPQLLGFLEAVQLPTGELPYELAGRYQPRERIHYLCYQYNAFQCMKLAWHAAAHDDKRARAIAIRLANYIAGGVTASGAVRASCHSALPEVVYYADAVGMALHTVTRLGWADYGALADRAFAWVLSRQRADGGFPFSRGDYLVLSDRNAYPRYLAMTLYHLAERARTAGSTP